jgi:hypothetical protein
VTRSDWVRRRDLLSWGRNRGLCGLRHLRGVVSRDHGGDVLLRGV